MGRRGTAEAEVGAGGWGSWIVSSYVQWQGQGQGRGPCMVRCNESWVMVTSDPPPPVNRMTDVHH